MPTAGTQTCASTLPTATAVPTFSPVSLAAGIYQRRALLKKLERILQRHISLLKLADNFVKSRDRLFKDDV